MSRSHLNFQPTAIKCFVFPLSILCTPLPDFTHHSTCFSTWYILQWDIILESRCLAQKQSSLIRRPDNSTAKRISSTPAEPLAKFSPHILYLHRCTSNSSSKPCMSHPLPLPAGKHCSQMTSSTSSVMSQDCQTCSDKCSCSVPFIRFDEIMSKLSYSGILVLQQCYS